MSRELIDHLERNLIPRTRELHDLVKPDSPFADSGNQVQDVTVRNHVASLLESQEFTERLFEKTSQYLTAIDQELTKLTGGP